MTEIPTAVRNLVKARDRFLCVRCGMRGQHLHHRRTRAVVDEHQHCCCNLVLLCTRCHQWAHGQPFLARADGIIVSKYALDIEAESVTAVSGSMHLDCQGGFTWVIPPWQSH